MIVLLPVSRYRVRYQLGSGRPYSYFERLVLEAIGEGQSSLSSIQHTFRLHRRTIIESIVTLMEAGWVAFERNTHKLVVTADGERAIGCQERLPNNIIVSDRTDYLVGERVQAQLAKSTDIIFSPKSTLQPYWDQVAVLSAGDIPHPLEPGIVVPLLRRYEGEWIRWCGAIDIVRDGADFVVVDVDTSSGSITGIPTKWVPLLRDDLLERARRKERQLLLAGTFSIDPALASLVQKEIGSDKHQDADPDEWMVEPGLERAVLGSSDHDALLADRLENARSYVAIVTGTLDSATVKRLEERFRAALARGVSIDVMWGSEPEQALTSHRDAVELIKKIEYDSRSLPLRGRLTFSRTASGSNANILFSDLPEGFEVIVGSYDWLGEFPGERWVDLSLTFRESGLVSRLCRLLADLAAADERISTGTGVTRLRHAAAELEQRGAEAAQRRSAELSNATPISLKNAFPAEELVESGEMSDSEVPPEPTSRAWRVRLVVGRQHRAILSTLAPEARRRLVVSCHRWGTYSEVAFSSLRESLERGCKLVDVRYGLDVAPGADHERLAAEFEKLGGVIRQIPGLRANAIVLDDDTAAVTSLDLLSPDLDSARPSAGEIGFVLRGKGVSSVLLERVGIVSSERHAPIEGVYIAAFRIEGVRSISSLSWSIAGEKAAGWHVLVGDNGSGKTTVLRAIALALIGTENARALRQDWGTWLHSPHQTEAKVEVELQHGNAAESSSRRTLRLTWTPTEDGATLSEESSEQKESPFSSGYGPFRRLTGGDLEFERQLSAFPQLARHLSLFDERVALTEGLAWLQELRFKSLESDGESILLLNRTINLVNECGLLPHGVRLSQVKSDAVKFQDERGREFNIEELSDGFRSILSLTFDIVRQLAITYGAARVFNSERHEIIDVPGIILIDEIDAHLHPSWQRVIGQWFRRHFPLIQFIVTTHSPLVCQAAEVGTVFRLPNPSDDFDSGGMLGGSALARLVYGNVLDAYASGAFGEDVTRSEASKEHLRRLAELNRKELVTALSDEEQIEQAELRATFPSTAHATVSEEY